MSSAAIRAALELDSPRSAIRATILRRRRENSSVTPDGIPATSALLRLTGPHSITSRSVSSARKADVEVGQPELGGHRGQDRGREIFGLAGILGARGLLEGDVGNAVVDLLRDPRPLLEQGDALRPLLDLELETPQLRDVASNP